MTPCIGCENARLGEKVSARVITVLTIIRFAIQNLLGGGTRGRSLPCHFLRDFYQAVASPVSLIIVAVINLFAARIN